MRGGAGQVVGGGLGELMTHHCLISNDARLFKGRQENVKQGAEAVPAVAGGGSVGFRRQGRRGGTHM